MAARTGSGHAGWRGRTAADGLGKPDRFIWCAGDTLDGDIEAIMCFKHATTNHSGRVSIATDLKVDDPQHDHFTTEAARAGFVTRITEAKNLLIEVSPSAALRFNMVDPVADQLEAIEALAEAANALRDWWNSLVA